MVLRIYSINYGFLSNHLRQRKQQGGQENHRATITLMKNDVFKLSHGVKNINRSELYQ